MVGPMLAVASKAIVGQIEPILEILISWPVEGVNFVIYM